MMTFAQRSFLRPGIRSAWGRIRYLCRSAERRHCAHAKGTQSAECIDEIVVVTKYERLQELADICHDHGISKASKVVVGGKTRLESSLIGVSNADERAKYIAIHDGARPFVTNSLIERVVHSAHQHGASAPAVSATDTVRILNVKGAVVETPSRDLVALMQTPQVFLTEMIKAA